MSLIAETVSRLDTEIDKLQLHSTNQFTAPEIPPTNEINDLRAAVRSLSTSRTLLPRRKVLDVLKQARSQHSKTSTSYKSPYYRYETDLMWLLAGKAAVQTFGSVMNSLLERSLALNREIWYWDEILGSYCYTGLYIVQTLPSRLWVQMGDFYSSLKSHYNNDVEPRFDSISNRWERFYELVQHSIRERSEWHARLSILSPFARCRSEVRQRQKALKNLRDVNASCIGLLVEECLAFGIGDDLNDPGKHILSNHEWHNVVYKSVLLMDTILQSLTDPNVAVTEFEDGVFTTVENEVQGAQNRLEERVCVQPIDVIDRLICILQERLPGNALSTGALIRKYGRPSRLVRYWLPASTILLSLSTVLKILTSRKADLLTWLSEFGLTVIDFWTNWVVKPTEKLIGTIRHDEKSEIAIMSRNSLVADRASLERMVIDFVLDHPDLNHEKVRSDISAIAANVREGDLTPVLMAYERDLRRPFVGTLRGDLIRALLIQIQKTKVDVEIAISGIDALLKSQELVFGFVGLTPGILVSYATFRWIGSVLGNRKGLQKGKEKDGLRRALRNIDRILTRSSSGSNNILSYKDHGYFICEIHIMSYRAKYTLPRSVFHDFKEDMADLMDVSRGVDKQLKAVSRIQWAYSKWI
ncbi:hypothetical protein VTN77DRAFT_8533 [Rasamsonia byssochlamydoides]|uniref:uncharacterized protein n=1 Tax=Rasamsonia byssochlamydoides TaxID=89139 RepID=UPI0037441432